MSRTYYNSKDPRRTFASTTNSNNVVAGNVRQQFYSQVQTKLTKKLTKVPMQQFDPRTVWRSPSSTSPSPPQSPFNPSPSTLQQQRRQGTPTASTTNEDMMQLDSQPFNSKAFTTIKEFVPDIFEDRSRLHKFNSKFQEMNMELRKNIVSEYYSVLEPTAKKHPHLSNSGNLTTLKNAIESVYSKNHVLFSFDVEAFEFDQRMITELGISIYDPAYQQFGTFPHIKQIHVIVKEFSHKVNGKFVPNNKDNFLGGPSLVMSAVECKKFIQQLIDYYFKELPTIDSSIKGAIFVGHGPAQDLRWFSDMGVKFPLDFKLLDTQHLWQLSHGNHGGSLSRILRYMEVPHSYMHNAGNDCYYTLLLALNLCDPQIRILKRLDEWNREDPTEIKKKKEEKRKLKEERRKLKEKDNGAGSTSDACTTEDEDSGLTLNVSDNVGNAAGSPQKDKKRKRKIKANVFDIVNNMEIDTVHDALKYLFDSSHKPFIPLDDPPA